ncbi:hypothetical protein GJ699_15995 [Duganella sp. FT80W]|uniref:Uncharacterized protein n=1 Tax=Duganella guangzhouensis TaxID=2666084 RepID=A0A6I2KZ88_9BURK|nr:hypothetical protein [Duganella guangzhouensis]MRW91495.1 hypothetical protein [Duganella guangzhouensis]
MKITKIISFLLGMLCFSCQAWATDVSVAGFAFAGDFQSAAQRFPRAYRLFTLRQGSENIQERYSAMVAEKAGAINNPQFHFTRAGMVNLQADRALMAALVLTGETVVTEHYGNYYKTFVNLRADTLIFDYKNQTIVRNCPVNVVLFDATTQAPSEERLSGFVDNLIRRPDEKGLISQFAQCLQRATLPGDNVRTLQVRKGEVSAEALAAFPEILRNNPATVQAMLADTLGSVLSSRLGLSMLPSSIGHTGGVMSLRLENGDDIKLTLPSGDYVFDIKLNKFAKLKTAETSVSTTYVYGAYMSLGFSEPLMNTAFIQTDLKNGEVAVLPTGQVNSDDFSAYQDAVRGLYTKFADALAQPAAAWIKTAASAKDIEAQMAVARDTLRKIK